MNNLKQCSERTSRNLSHVGLGMWGEIMEDTGSFVVSEASWLLPGIRIVVIIESCRRLLKDERQAYEATKTELQMRKRHLLPSVQALRPGRYTSLVSLVSLVLLEVVEVLVFLAPE